ncbi:MAG: hypothetical protein IIZ40_00720 [Bacilli bacterium]|nr:hypothetical protein [Bacilli bacterium]
MEKKAILIITLIGVVFSTMFTFLIISFKNHYSSSLSASVAVKEDNNLILKASKKYVSDNIDNYDGEVIININDLIENNYVSNEELENLNKEYTDKLRIIVIVKDKEIKDAYIKNDLFKNVYSCDDLCYLNNDNYIAYNNDIYKIIKIDQEGYLYITNEEEIKIIDNDIDYTLKNYFNNSDKSISSSVLSLTDDDINNSDFIIENDIIVNTSSGYKKYNSVSENIEELDDSVTSIIPVIQLKNDLSYEMGDGSKFNPFILAK